MGDQDNQGRAPGSGTVDATLRGPQSQKAGTGVSGVVGSVKPKDRVDSRVDTSVKRLNEGLRTHDAARAQKARPSTPPTDSIGSRPSQAPGPKRPSKAPEPAGRAGPEAAPDEELDYVAAQVKAAESELEAARARAEAAKVQLDTVKGRSELLQEQLEAARGQVEAAQAQARAAEAQHEAATVQAEAAIAQAEVCREQHENLKTHDAVLRAQAATVEAQTEALKAQIGVMRSQADTLEEQVGVMRRQARGTTWLAVLSALSALSMAALAGLAIYGFLRLPSGAALAQMLGGAGAPGPRPAAAPEPAATDETGAASDVASQLEPLQTEQQRTSAALFDLTGRLGQVAARLAEAGDGGATTDRVSLSSPPLEGPAAELAWSAPTLHQWLSKASRGPRPDERRSTYELRGSVRRPVKRGARVTVDVLEGQWWPAGGAIDVDTNGSFSGSILIDPEAPPSQIKVTVWEEGAPASREWAIASTAAPAAPPAAAAEGTPAAPPAKAPRPGKAGRAARAAQAAPAAADAQP